MSETTSNDDEAQTEAKDTNIETFTRRLKRICENSTAEEYEQLVEETYQADLETATERRVCPHRLF
jgi:hypothetical protein